MSWRTLAWPAIRCCGVWRTPNTAKATKPLLAFCGGPSDPVTVLVTVIGQGGSVQPRIPQDGMGPNPGGDMPKQLPLEDREGQPRLPWDGLCDIFSLITY